MHSLPLITRARAASLLAAGALGAIAWPARAQTNPALRLAALPIENAAEVYFAEDLGLFTKAGINVDVQRMLSSSSIVAGLVANVLDIGWSTVDVLATIHQKGVPIVIVAPASEFVYPATEAIAALVVSANSPVHSAKDLNGKTIATGGLNSIAETAPRAWIDQNGGDSSTVKFVEVPIPAMPAALDEGRVDAANIVEPYVSAALKKGRVLAYSYEAIGKRFIIGTWAATRQWADANPDLVARFASAVHQAAIWANASRDPAERTTILAKYTRMAPAVIEAVTRSRYAETLMPALLQPLIDVSAKYNGFARFPAKELIWSPK